MARAEFSVHCSNCSASSSFEALLFLVQKPCTRGQIRGDTSPSTGTVNEPSTRSGSMFRFLITNVLPAVYYSVCRVVWTRSSIQFFCLAGRARIPRLYESACCMLSWVSVNNKVFLLASLATSFWQNGSGVFFRSSQFSVYIWFSIKHMIIDKIK